MDSDELRGRLNLITYAIDFSDRVANELVARRAEEVIQQRIYHTPPSVLFEALTEGVSSDLTVLLQGQHEHNVRDFLIRLRDALEARKPWPVPPLAQLDAQEWPALTVAKPVAQIPLSEMQVRARLNRGFDEVSGVGRVLVLKLRSGETVALRAPAGYTEPGVALLADTDDPAATIAAFRELAGFTEDEVVPV